MVTRAIFVKCVQNGLQFTFCLITSPVFEVQKCNTPFWKLARLRRPPAAFLLNKAITRGANVTKTFRQTCPSYMQSFIKIGVPVLEKSVLKTMTLCNFNKDEMEKIISDWGLGLNPWLAIEVNGQRSFSWISLTAHGSTHHGRVTLDSLNRSVQITRSIIAIFSVSIGPVLATFCFVAIFAASFITGFLRLENSFIYEMFQTIILNFVT